MNARGEQIEEASLAVALPPANDVAGLMPKHRASRGAAHRERQELEGLSVAERALLAGISEREVASSGRINLSGRWVTASLASTVRARLAALAPHVREINLSENPLNIDGLEQVCPEMHAPSFAPMSSYPACARRFGRLTGPWCGTRRSAGLCCGPAS